MKKTVFAFLFVFFAAASASGAETARQVVENGALKDLDYGFELARPSDGWEFLKEKTIGAMNPDAIAGMYSNSKKVFLAVVAEEISGNSSMADYASLLYENARIDDKNIESKGEVTVNGLGAYRMKFSGKINGLKIIFVYSIFRHENFIYQVISWCVGGGFAFEEPKELVESHGFFKFTPGVKPAVREVRGPSKAVGIGWRIENDVYENPVCSIRCKKSEGWRFMDTVELNETNSDASLGLEHLKAGAYATLIAEPVRNMTSAEFEKMMMSNFEQTREISAPHVKTPVKISGMDVSRHDYKDLDISGLTMDFSYMAFVRGGFGYQLVVWWEASKRERAYAAIQTLLSSLVFMTDEEKKKSAAEIVKYTDVERSVATGESFRNLVYRNFNHGLTVKFPAGFWKHLLGTAASQENPDASLFMSEVEKGLNVCVVLEKSEDATGEEYHAAALKLMDPPDGTTTEIIKTGGIEIRSSRFTKTENDVKSTYRLLSSGAGSRFFSITMSGMAENLKSTAELENCIISGIAFKPSPDSETEESAGKFTDHRFGFQISAPEKWKFEDITPFQFRPVCRLVCASDPGKKIKCFIGAIYAFVEMQLFLKELLPNIEYTKKMNLQMTSDKSVDWLGRSAQLLIFEDSSKTCPNPIEVLSVYVSGVTFFMVIANESDAAGNAALRESLKLTE
jgi:hypothetical protein